jgi:4-deoxy-L-threo-5-hexosulose-uronate ketol-isomerase
METRYLPNHISFSRLTTKEIRSAFVFENLFEKDKIALTYIDIDRTIVGSAVPIDTSLKLESSKKEMAAEYFCERREIGIINIGESGSVSVDGKEYILENKELLYIGRGSKEIYFSSENSSAPALFYIVSYPAHKEYPTAHMTKENADVRHIGTQAGANVRKLSRYIHKDGVQSCQLVMGFTELFEGSVWNTMPPHTHPRRSEIYLYFEMKEDNIVVHLMGEPTETRSVIMRNHQAIISPGWSVHCAAGTSNYTFVWAMGGENQAFDDMDEVPLSEIR